MRSAICKNGQRASHIVPFWIAVAFLLAAGQPSYGVEFKGVEIGAPLWLSQERSVFGTLDCNPMSMDPDEYQAFIEDMQSTMPGVRKVCAGSTSIATVPANVTVLLGTSRRVLRLTLQISGEDYSRVVDAMIDKWGPGVVEVRDVNDESIWWDFDDETTVSVHKMPIEGQSGDGSNEDSAVGLVEYSIAVLTPSGDL